MNIQIGNETVSKKTFMKWLKALRSGDYRQTQGYLQRNGGFCCLGVACDVLIPESQLELESYGRIKGDMPTDQENAPKWLQAIDRDFRRKTGLNLTTLNDGIGPSADELEISKLEAKTKFSFSEIADLLEAVYVHGALNEVANVAETQQETV